MGSERVPPHGWCVCLLGTVGFHGTDGKGKESQRHELRGMSSHPGPVLSYPDLIRSPPRRDSTLASGPDLAGSQARQGEAWLGTTSRFPPPSVQSTEHNRKTEGQSPRLDIVCVSGACTAFWWATGCLPAPRRTQTGSQQQAIAGPSRAKKGLAGAFDAGLAWSWSDRSPCGKSRRPQQTPSHLQPTRMGGRGRRQKCRWEVLELPSLLFGCFGAGHEMLLLVLLAVA